MTSRWLPRKHQLIFKPHPGKSIDVVRVTNNLIAAFAGATVLAEDIYSAERAQLVKTAAELEIAGKPLRRLDVMLASITNKEHALGPGKSISIPVDNTQTLSGEICRTGIVLRTDAPLTHPVVHGVWEFLNSLEEGEARFVAR